MKVMLATTVKPLCGRNVTERHFSLYLAFKHKHTNPKFGFTPTHPRKQRKLPGNVALMLLLGECYFFQERDLGDEYGWKQVHGDVFRPASSPALFSALVGTGYQITTVAFCVIMFAMVGELYTE